MPSRFVLRPLAHLALFAALWWALAHGVAAAEAAAGELPSYTVTARDGRLQPELLRVPAGRRIKLVLINEGPGPLEFENDEMRIEKVLAAGATSFVILPKLAPGRYEFIDEFNIATGLLVIEAQ